MNRKVLFAAAMLAGVYTAPASAQVVIDMSMITCGEFAQKDPAIKSLIASWMSGYFSASKNLNMLQFDYLKRNKEKVGAYCKKHKDDTLMGAVMKAAR
jgi:acid stress chaperone HdeB